MGNAQLGQSQLGKTQLGGQSLLEEVVIQIKTKARNLLKISTEAK